MDNVRYENKVIADGAVVRQRLIEALNMRICFEMDRLMVRQSNIGFESLLADQRDILKRRIFRDLEKFITINVQEGGKGSDTVLIEAEFSLPLIRDHEVDRVNNEMNELLAGIDRLNGLIDIKDRTIAALFEEIFELQTPSWPVRYWLRFVSFMKSVPNWK